MKNEIINLSNKIPINQDSHDMVEAYGKSLLVMSKLCKPKLQGTKVLYESLNNLETYYKQLYHNDNFFNTFYQLLNQLTNTYDPVLE